MIIFCCTKWQNINSSKPEILDFRQKTIKLQTKKSFQREHASIRRMRDPKHQQNCSTSKAQKAFQSLRRCIRIFYGNPQRSSYRKY